jgi:ABC-type phosphate transport system substrate-binding protein
MKVLLRSIATVALAVAFAAFASPAAAQKAPAGKPSGARATPAAAAPSLLGQWAGTVTVQLGDSTITAPVFYTFAESGGATTGTAMVPGQGTGPISNVVRSGAGVKFRVTAKQGEPGKETLRHLEHDGAIGADGAMAGMVTLDGKPVAKFRIMPKK